MAEITELDQYFTQLSVQSQQLQITQLKTKIINKLNLVSESKFYTDILTQLTQIAFPTQAACVCYGESISSYIYIYVYMYKNIKIMIATLIPCYNIY